ncbi:hypothetical protein HMPREF0294_1114 [Corynebacterium glucuronolyticum ATCC 51867]|nr:hypothetical protein HMPREF0294_1114 [Corynebacterium glucuronolyticum ATCC 51867]
MLAVKHQEVGEGEDVIAWSRGMVSTPLKCFGNTACAKPAWRNTGPAKNQRAPNQRGVKSVSRW